MRYKKCGKQSTWTTNVSLKVDQNDTFWALQLLAYIATLNSIWNVSHFSILILTREIWEKIQLYFRNVKALLSYYLHISNFLCHVQRIVQENVYLKKSNRGYHACSCIRIQTFKGTLTCSHPGGTVIYETCIVGQEEYECVTCPGCGETSSI